MLVIEDSRDARTSATSSSIDDFPVETAATAAQALAGRLARLAAVILDRRLPDGSVHELLPEHPGARAPEAAVIIVTGYSDLHGRDPGPSAWARPTTSSSRSTPTASAPPHRPGRRAALAGQGQGAIRRHLPRPRRGRHDVMIVMLRCDETVMYFQPVRRGADRPPAADVLGKSYLDLFVPRRAAGRGRAAPAGGCRACRSEGPSAGSSAATARTAGCSRTPGRLGGYDGDDVLLIVQHDITERQHAQERGSSLNASPPSATLVTGLAHESRNALQHGDPGLPRPAGAEGQDRPEAALNLIVRLQKAQDDLQRLFEDVQHHMPRPIKLERRSVDLAEVWRAELGQPRRRPPRAHRHPRRARRRRRPAVRGRPFRLGQVFRNVLDNALGLPGGRVVISASETRLDGARRPAAVSVLDSPGLDAEQRLKIFDSFYTTKTKGTGLGMAIVRRIVDAHGERIAVGEHQGPGAEIILTLPRGIP
ncbi:MAG: ATP-binding protein [Isosphaeraceae bacterium]